MNVLAGPPAAVTPEQVSPGLAGFLVVFVLAVVTVLLIRSMVGHLRKVRYSPGPDAGTPKTGEPDEAPRQSPPEG